MTRMMKLVGIALVAATLAALAGVWVAGDLSTALAQANTPATGAPVIEGAAQLDEGLLARPWGHISDADGMTNPVFRYQWISNDGTSDTDIDGATSSSYTIVAADVGKTIKVRVSFADDAGNPEMLTSAPTGVVSGQRNSATTGLPTIGGTPQVGQKLTVNTSGIADADGLTNVSYGATWSAGEGYLRGQIGQGYDLSYTVSRRDVGMTLDVTVNFKDDAGKYASLTSAPTAVVAATSPAAPGNFAVSPNAAGDPGLSWEEPMWDLGGEILGRKTWGDGGSPITGYVVQWKEDADSWDTAADVSEATVTGTSHTIEGLTDGKDYTIRVIAVNNVGRGIPSAEATVTINRPGDSTDATLSALTLSGIDFGTFASGTTSYTAQVANSVSQTTVTPTVNHAGASYVIKLGSVTNADGVIELAVGSNIITIEVTAEDDSTTRAYTVTVTRAQPPTPNQPSSDAALTALTLSWDRFRLLRLDDPGVHGPGGQQRVADDRDTDRAPFGSELRHQARRRDRRRRGDRTRCGRQRNHRGGNRGRWGRFPSLLRGGHSCRIVIVRDIRAASDRTVRRRRERHDREERGHSGHQRLPLW